MDSPRDELADVDFRVTAFDEKDAPFVALLPQIDTADLIVDCFRGELLFSVAGRDLFADIREVPVLSVLMSLADAIDSFSEGEEADFYVWDREGKFLIDRAGAGVVVRYAAVERRWRTKWVTSDAFDLSVLRSRCHAELARCLGLALAANPWMRQMDGLDEMIRRLGLTMP